MKEIKLRNGEISFVDDEDYERISAHKWFARKSRNTFYAGTHPTRNTYRNMHRMILNLTDKKQIVDHIDGNGLNNIKSNLRICSTGQNLCNRIPHKNKSSRFLGVSWNKGVEKWTVYIRKNRKSYYFGVFIDERDAAIKYNEKAKELHGEFARLNVIPDK